MENQSVPIDHVFVLGAGASKEYGLPTGGDLRNLILDHGLDYLRKSRTVPNRNRVAIQNLGKTQFFQRAPEWSIEEDEELADHVTEMIKQLSVYRHSSIDQFLSTHTKYADIGREIIASILLQAEHAAYTRRSYSEGPYTALIKLAEKYGSWDTFVARNKFITFNYDRTLEYMMASMVPGYFPSIMPQQALSRFQSSIIHVYGSLDADMQYNTQQYRYMIGTERPERWARKSASSISIISRNRDNDTISNSRVAAEWLKQAKCVIVLGFGFDQTNCTRIGLINDPDTTNTVINFGGTPLFATVRSPTGIPDPEGQLKMAGFDIKEISSLGVSDLLHKYVMRCNLRDIR